jgi:predicted dehydrogenase
MSMKTDFGGMSSAVVPRRRFLAGTASAAALTLVKPGTAFGAAANEKIQLGLIGCGGRGAWIANLFEESGLYKLVACSDYFQDRVDAVGEKFGIDKGRRFTGLSGYKRLLECKLEAVAIETPPYFHPQQALDAVEAGKHVFVAKPIAVDVPGCQMIAEAGKRATSKKLVFLVDFQTRANELYREAVARIRKGDLGTLVMGEAHYPWSGGGRTLPPADPEARLRQWYCVLALSGDFIVEQAIHALDVATWILNADPERAMGVGGAKTAAKREYLGSFFGELCFPGWGAAIVHVHTNDTRDAGRDCLPCLRFRRLHLHGLLWERLDSGQRTFQGRQCWKPLYNRRTDQYQGIPSIRYHGEV